jgi:hypothetical protein
VKGRTYIQRNRALGHATLMQDYFAEVPTYPPNLFCRRYRMRRSLFVKIVGRCGSQFQLLQAMTQRYRRTRI